MTFAHPWMLLLILAPLGWAVREWPSNARPLNLAMKAASFALILIALAEPTITMPETKTGAVVLVDTSASVSDADLRRESSLVSGMAASRGRNWMRVVPFARRPREMQPGETSAGWRIQYTPGDEGKATNLEAALRDSMSAVPSGRIPRLVLISDGNENEGSSARAIAQLQRVAVPVDTFALDGRARSGLQLLSASMPRQAYAGEQIPIDLRVESPSDLEASIDVTADGKEIGANPVSLKAGTNELRVHARVKTTGAVAIAGKLTAASGGDVEFEQAVELRRARFCISRRTRPARKPTCCRRSTKGSSICCANAPRSIKTSAIFNSSFSTTSTSIPSPPHRKVASKSTSRTAVVCF